MYARKEPDSHPGKDYAIDYVGEYTQRERGTMLDAQRRPVEIEPGTYHIMGAFSLDGEKVREAGIVFEGRDVGTGAPSQVVDFVSPQRVKELARAGDVELAPGVTSKMLDGREKTRAPRLPEVPERDREHALGMYR